MPRDGTKNLIPLNKRSKEVQKKIQQMGRIANKEKWEKKKSIQEAIPEVLSHIIKDKTGKEYTNAVAMVLAMVNKAIKGDVKAFNAIADLVCDKKQKLDVTSSDGSMSPKGVTMDLSAFTPEQIADMAKAAYRGE